MTVSAIHPLITLSYTGPGDYVYPFLCYDEENLYVIYIDQDGVRDSLLLGTDYSVTLEEDFVGGTITVTNPIDFTGGVLLVGRVLPLTQEVDWVNNDPLDAELLERSFDRVVMILQQMNQEVIASTTAFQWLGLWVTGTLYQVRALVEAPDGGWYYCTTSHTAGDFDTDLAVGFWVLLIDRANLMALVAAAEEAEAGAVAAQIAAEYAMTKAQEAAEAMVDAWEDDPTSYDFPDMVAGSNGRTYRCLGTDVVGVDPTTDDGTNWYDVFSGGIPVGSVVAYVYGHYTSSINTGFTPLESEATVNARINPLGWYVCNGAALNLAGSPIFGGSGRYLPDLTDSRFLMGYFGPGHQGGTNDSSHTHATNVASFNSGATTAPLPAHTHVHAQAHTNTSGGVVDGSAQDFNHSWNTGGGTQYPTSSTGTGGSHTHTVDPPSTTSSTPSVTDNRPKWLSCLFIIKVK